MAHADRGHRGGRGGTGPEDEGVALPAVAAIRVHVGQVVVLACTH